MYTEPLRHVYNEDFENIGDVVLEVREPHIPIFTDTHCHILNEYYEDTANIIKNAQNKGITKMINNGVDPQSNKEVLETAKKYPNMYAAIGIHPEYADSYKETDIDFIESHIQDIVAVGEIGLDYHYENANRNKQIELFEKQLKLALKYNKPVIIHSRDATEDTIKTLKKYQGLRGSIHCFAGSLETAKIYIKLGYKLGIGGVATFKNAKIKEVIKELNDEDILLETDSPYLAPVPLRGEKNEPQNVRVIAEFIADIKGVSLEYLSTKTEANVRNIFDI